MLDLHIRYESVNVYEHPVHEAVFDLLVKPCMEEFQSVQSCYAFNNLGIEPYAYLNPFGFEVERLRMAASFVELHYILEARVSTRPRLLPDKDPLPPDETMGQLRDPLFQIERFPYLRPTHYTTVHASAALPVWRPGHSLLAYYHSLSQALRNAMAFEVNETTVETTAHEALALGKGVCQDFTHVFIGWCRRQGLPARYLSGYLSQGFGFAGDLQMHAWPEVWLPGHGWIGFDPANDCLADARYVKVAHGADYADCSPLRGVIRTAGAHETQHRVHVTAMEQSQAQQQ